MKSIYFFLHLLLLSATSYAQSNNYAGIDVSNHNGDIAWKEVKQNKTIQFVYIKATEGKTYVDPKYKKNIQNAQKNGFKVGSYHFFRMTSGAHEQFKHFKKVVNRDKQDLIPLIDDETTDRH